ncbi:protein of unknown function (plasmid) [Azospirillum baldaniorum]|uniref:Uncharacterized protein n=1 Tax=Azospirillum baldaniorum TaxID=1064539 RepID=A0A9P1NQS2_9PROT|nr:protein of unknown function [Azospirillum baldaniorum]
MPNEAPVALRRRNDSPLTVAGAAPDWPSDLAAPASLLAPSPERNRQNHDAAIQPQRRNPVKRNIKTSLCFYTPLLRR